VEFYTYIPHTISSFVKSFWYLRISGSRPFREEIIPDGHHEIIFHLDKNPAKRLVSEKGWIQEPNAFVAGQTLKSYTLEIENDSVLYGIRFYPHTLTLLFGIPAVLTTDEVFSLENLPYSALLLPCVSEFPDQTFRNFEQLLYKIIHRANVNSNAFRLVEASVLEILKHNGVCRIDHLICELGISQRYLDTLFKKFVGLNPKSFCNIIQLNFFINYKNQHAPATLTQCAYEAQFFDQSHLIKSFKAIIGKTPRQYFDQNYYISNRFAAL